MVLACNNNNPEQIQDNALVKKTTETNNGLVNPDTTKDKKVETEILEFGERINIKLTPYIPEYENLTVQDKEILTTRLNEVLSMLGYGGEGSNPRFIIGPSIILLSSEITSTAPTLFSNTYEVTFFVLDIIEETTFASFTTQFKGAGQSQTKCFINGFREINLKTKAFYDFLKTAENKISDYYKMNCDKFLIAADAEMQERNYESAYTILKNIPLEADICYMQAQKKRESVFKAILKNDCNEVFAKMKAEFGKMNDPSASGYNEEAMAYYLLIDRESTCFSEAETIYNQYIKQLKPQQKRDWDLKIKQMELERTFQLDSIKKMNEFNLKMKEFETQAIVQGNTALLEKYKENYYYERLPWLRRIFHFE